MTPLSVLLNGEPSYFVNILVKSTCSYMWILYAQDLTRVLEKDSISCSVWLRRGGGRRSLGKLPSFFILFLLSFHIFLYLFRLYFPWLFQGTNNGEYFLRLKMYFDSVFPVFISCFCDANANRKVMNTRQVFADGGLCERKSCESYCRVTLQFPGWLHGHKFSCFPVMMTSLLAYNFMGKPGNVLAHPWKWRV